MSGPRLIAIRVLTRGELRQPIGRRRFLGGFSRQLVQIEKGRQPTLDPVLHFDRDPFRAVEAADRHRDAVPVQVAEEQRRAAVATETTLDKLRALEHPRRATRPDEVIEPHAGERREVVAERLLAHPAMADARLRRLGIERIAHGTALAAAGHNGGAFVLHLRLRLFLSRLDSFCPLSPTARGRPCPSPRRQSRSHGPPPARDKYSTRRRRRRRAAPLSSTSPRTAA